MEFDGGGARWLADRTVKQGEEVTWTYGALSNSDLFLQYDFVPANFLHGDARVEFTLPGFLFEQSLQALSGARTTPGVGPRGAPQSATVPPCFSHVYLLSRISTPSRYLCPSADAADVTAVQVSAPRKL